mmetsp:Transcript_62872/g.147989  ORF Transcript_62872/g.147989 Transcript_62872/m.147989 type:complete len:204 (-) Transcript_62872:483-1094(-)
MLLLRLASARLTLVVKHALAPPQEVGFEGPDEHVGYHCERGSHGGSVSDAERRHRRHVPEVHFHRLLLHGQEHAAAAPRLRRHPLDLDRRREVVDFAGREHGEEHKAHRELRPLRHRRLRNVAKGSACLLHHGDTSVGKLVGGVGVGLEDAVEERELVFERAICVAELLIFLPERQALLLHLLLPLFDGLHHFLLLGTTHLCR